MQKPPDEVIVFWSIHWDDTTMVFRVDEPEKHVLLGDEQAYRYRLIGPEPERTFEHREEVPAP